MTVSPILTSKSKATRSTLVSESRTFQPPSFGSMMSKLIITAIVGILLACSSDHSDYVSLSDPKNIFDEDNRISVQPTSYPLNAVGRIATKGSEWCTAFLVGKNLIATNAHCLVVPYHQLTFYRAYNDYSWAESAQIVTAVRGTNDPGNRVGDWAIMLLDRDMTVDQWFEFDFATNFEYTDISTEQYERPGDTEGPYSLAGYPKDFSGHNLMYEQGCDITGRNAEWGYLYHDCDNKVGASGSPIYNVENGVAKVVGINSAERFEDWDARTLPADGSKYRHHIANLATSLDRLKVEFQTFASKYVPGVDRTSPETRDIEICNRTDKKIFAALAFREYVLDDRELVRGWYVLEKQSCMSYPIKAISKVYGFAWHWSSGRPISSEAWPEARDRAYCVHTQNGFTIDSDRPCRVNEAQYLFQPFGEVPEFWEINPR